MQLTKAEIICYIIGGLIVIASGLCFIGLSYNFMIQNQESITQEPLESNDK